MIIFIGIIYEEVDNDTLTSCQGRCGHIEILCIYAFAIWNLDGIC